MESKEELWKIDIKSHRCYYFDDIITDKDIDFDNILLDEKLYKKEYENNLIYDISWKTSMCAKPLHFRFDKIDEFIKVLGGEIRHLVLFDYGLFDKISYRIKYCMSEKSGITDSEGFCKDKSDTQKLYLFIIKTLFW